MMPFDKLSYWEKVTYFQNIDCLIVGSGIVGLSTALALKQRENHAKIVVIERGYLPTGASTKNAGFACFGSPSELLSDLKIMGKEKTKDLLRLRWEGLQLLLNTIGKEVLEFQACGSYDLFRNSEKASFDLVLSQLSYLNEFIEESIGLKNCYSSSQIPQEQGMLDLCGSVFNQYEGSIHTGKMMHRLIQLAHEQGISIINGLAVSTFQDVGNYVEVETQFGKIQAGNVFICTNGLSKKLLPHLDLQPARAQVLVTSPIKNLKLNSTYHYDSGYYYFRIVDGNRILIGGARNQDFIGETTENMEVTETIKGHIVRLLGEVIVPNREFTIDYEWAGIMGVGQEKRPIIESQTPRIHYAVRMGGMGVAMGMAIGERLSTLGLR